jgi:hypothetical protein
MALSPTPRTKISNRYELNHIGEVSVYDVRIKDDNKDSEIDDCSTFNSI